eukprot:CAMPEP_0198149586 /NCGR_PEP_ID=MMETSP1443-20131203/47297_1 /TAXON_ID=186043 /ORGANISM="Entomoneis sp., Strain CCMP2396" /LENGTH=39 /DNA_ID= /DNA_START= /DNA_END= /DNA_ORIENTATION=
MPLSYTVVVSDDEHATYKDNVSLVRIHKQDDLTNIGDIE